MSSGFIIIGDKGPENETPLQAAIREFLSTDLRLPDNYAPVWDVDGNGVAQSEVAADDNDAPDTKAALSSDEQDRSSEIRAELLLPSGGDRLIDQRRVELYHVSRVELLVAFVDTYLVDVRWERLMVWHNPSSSPTTYQQEYTTRFSYKEGQSASTEIGLSAAFKGIGINFGHTTTRFSETETTTEEKKTQTIQVQPNTSMYFYQKVYNFRTYMRFTWQNNRVHHAVKRHDANRLLDYSTKSAIYSKEFLTTNNPLPSQATIEVNGITHTEMISGLNWESILGLQSILVLQRMGVI